MHIDDQDPQGSIFFFAESRCSTILFLQFDHHDKCKKHRHMLHVFICFHMIYVFICFLLFSWLKTIKHPIRSRSDPLPTGCAAGGAPATICPLGPVVDHEQGYQAGTKKKHQRGRHQMWERNIHVMWLKQS